MITGNQWKRKTGVEPQCMEKKEMAGNKDDKTLTHQSVNKWSNKDWSTIHFQAVMFWCYGEMIAYFFKNINKINIT